MIVSTGRRRGTTGEQIPRCRLRQAIMGIHIGKASPPPQNIVGGRSNRTSEIAKAVAEVMEELKTAASNSGRCDLSIDIDYETVATTCSWSPRRHGGKARLTLRERCRTAADWCLRDAS